MSHAPPRSALPTAESGPTLLLLCADSAEEIAAVPAAVEAVRHAASKYLVRLRPVLQLTREESLSPPLLSVSKRDVTTNRAVRPGAGCHMLGLLAVDRSTDASLSWRPVRSFHDDSVPPNR